MFLRPEFCTEECVTSVYSFPAIFNDFETSVVMAMNFISNIRTHARTHARTLTYNISNGGAGYS